MATGDQPTPLNSHTLETLCAELVSGRGIVTGSDGAIFQFLNPNTRSLFRWYQKNGNRWAGNVRKEDVEDLVDSLDDPPPAFPPTQIATLSGIKRGIYIKNIEVHNFGGMERFPDSKTKVEDFSQSLESKLVLIEGANGSGKTSFLSA